MYYLTGIVIILLALSFITYGYFASHYGIASRVAGNILLLFVGIAIISSGFSFETENQVIITSEDTTTVSKELISYSWLNTLLGTSLLLFGIAGFVGTWAEKKKRDNPYRGEY